MHCGSAKSKKLRTVLTATIYPLACGLAFAQHSRILLDDAMVRVTRIDLSRTQAYTARAARFGAVWVAFTPLTITAGPDPSK